jgi:NADH dehydrogenase/NADH:ubiquinone oxidoreductase subunit G
MSKATLNLDGKAVEFEPGQTILEVARAHGVFTIPTLCFLKDTTATGSCRMCMVEVEGARTLLPACATVASANMVVKTESSRVDATRKMVLELILSSGNHNCLVCEANGECELQALAYRYQMLAPRFPYLWPARAIDATAPLLMLEKNRCIQCLRCVRGVRAKDGRKIFAAVRRGPGVAIELDKKLAAKLSDQDALKAMDICPVGAILRKGKGFAVPVGRRKFDKTPIGSDVAAGNGR